MYIMFQTSCNLLFKHISKTLVISCRIFKLTLIKLKSGFFVCPTVNFPQKQNSLNCSLYIIHPTDFEAIGVIKIRQINVSSEVVIHCTKFAVNAWLALKLCTAAKTSDETFAVEEHAEDQRETRIIGMLCYVYGVCVCAKKYGRPKFVQRDGFCVRTNCDSVAHNPRPLSLHIVHAPSSCGWNTRCGLKILS